MGINKCRVCGNNFFEEPLLRYENMPAVAQYLPDVESLKSDKGIDIEVYQCSGCGLVQLNNNLVTYYKEVIRSSSYSGKMKEFRLKQFRNFVEKYALKDKKIVEIGCGNGEYLSIMQQFGVEAYGLEYSEESVKKCVDQGLDVFEGFVENNNYRMNKAPFDMFFMLNFLEHLPDPNSVLLGISNNLSDNAVGLVEVPNFDMILKKNLFSEFTSDHLLYFTKETLSATLRKNGFEIIGCENVWQDYIISAIVKKRERLDLSQFDRHQLKLKNEVEEYINRFKKKGVAIWGAGHQALAVISLTGLSNKIKYVIDSAPFKQNKFTPSTHIQIVSPERLDIDPVDAIIVMAASYSDEVAKIIRQKYSQKIAVAILRGFRLEEY